MSKLLKIAVPLALIIFILAPGVTGFLVESSIEKAESGYGKALALGPFELVGNNFDRGWFSSDQTVELNVTDPQYSTILHLLGGQKNDADNMPNILVDTKATHGVLPLASPSRGGLRPAVAQTESKLSLKYADGTIVPLPLTVYSSLGTGQWARLIAEPINTTSPDSNATIKWDGADIAAKFGNKSSYEGTIGAFNLASDGTEISATPLSFEGNFVRGDYAFPEGESSMSLDKITVTPPSAMVDASIVVNTISGEGKIEIENGRAVVESGINMGAIENPKLPVKSIQLASNYDLDAAAYSKMIEVMRQLQSEGGIEGDDVDPATSEAMFEALGAVLEKGGQFQLDKFNIELEDGTVSMNLDVELPPGNDSPQSAMANGVASGNIIIPESVVEALSEVSPDIAGGLAMASMMGFVQQKEGNYSASISYKNGVLLLNDMPVPLPF